jgi:hypothetical protein
MEAQMFKDNQEKLEKRTNIERFHSQISGLVTRFQYVR